MTDLRAERRAIAAQYFSDVGYRDLDIAYSRADKVIQWDIDNPPAWEAVKESLTVGWVKSSDRLPTEADAPRGWIHVSNFDFTDKSIMHVSLAHRWSYWHPATGIYQIPEPPR